MLKSTLIFVLLTFPFFLNAQNLYVKLGTGYAAGRTESNTGVVMNPTENEGDYMKYGGGINFSLAFGYAFNEHLSLGLEGSYFGSHNINSVFVDGLKRRQYDVLVKNYTLISPTVQLSTKRTNSYIYGKGGLVLPLSNEVEINQNTTVFEGVDNLIASTMERKASVKHHFGMGYKVALGAAYVLKNPKSAIYVEVEQVSLSVQPKTRIFTEWHEDDVDVLSTKNQSDIEVIFVDELEESTIVGGDNLPFYTLPTNNFFSHLNFKVGWEIHF